MSRASCWVLDVGVLLPVQYQASLAATAQQSPERFLCIEALLNAFISKASLDQPSAMVCLENLWINSQIYNMWICRGRCFYPGFVNTFLSQIHDKYSFWFWSYPLLPNYTELIQIITLGIPGPHGQWQGIGETSRVLPNHLGRGWMWSFCKSLLGCDHMASPEACWWQFWKGCCSLHRGADKVGPWEDIFMCQGYSDAWRCSQDVLLWDGSFALLLVLFGMAGTQ